MKITIESRDYKEVFIITDDCKFFGLSEIKVGQIINFVMAMDLNPRHKHSKQCKSIINLLNQLVQDSRES